jgi:hypothetical protein
MKKTLKTLDLQENSQYTSIHRKGISERREKVRGGWMKMFLK